MTDIFDHAQDIEQRYRDAALAHQANRSGVLSNSLTHCDDCDEPIPEARRLAATGCTRCIHCQAAFERFNP